MAASLSGVYNLQAFTDLGVLAAGYRLYTYAAGTTTQKTAYTDAAGTVPHTYTSDGLGGQYIALNSRGELPAPLFLAAGGYDIALKTPAGSTVWTRRAIGADDNSSTLRTDLANAASSSAGAALLAYSPTQAYGSGIGQFLNYLYARTAAEIAAGVTPTNYAYFPGDVRRYGAVGDGTTDSTAAIQAAITVAGAAFDADWFSTTNYTTPRVVDFPTASYKVNGGKIIVPRGVILRGNGSVMIGTGNTVSDNVCFETGYFSGGSLVTNVGAGNELHRCQFTKIQGFKFRNFKLALNLFNFNEGCEVSDCAFFNCYQNIYASRSWYARFVNLGSREASALAASTAAAYEFANFVNEVEISSVMCTNRVLGMRFSGGVNGLSLRNCSIENGTNGIKFDDNVNPCNIDSNYFEALTGVALDFSSGGGTNAITIDNNWFFDCATGISGANMLGGRIGRGNYFIGTTPTKVSITDIVSTIKVELPFLRTSSAAGSLLPALPSGYSFGAGVWVEYPVQNFDNGSGVTQVQQLYSSSPTPLPFSGKQGYVAGKVPFCDHSKTAGTTFNVQIDTKIAYESYVMTIFCIVIVDNVGTYRMEGRTFGTNVYADAAAGKTITASNNGGFLRLTFSSFTHPSSMYSCEGIVRMV